MGTASSSNTTASLCYRNHDPILFVTAEKNSSKWGGTNSDIPRWALSHWMKETRYHTVFISRNGKRKNTYFKNNQTLHFAQFSRTGQALLAALSKGRRDPFREDRAELPGPGEDNRILSIPHAAFQSFNAPENCKAFLFNTHSAIIQVTFMVY